MQRPGGCIASGFAEQEETALPGLCQIEPASQPLYSIANGTASAPQQGLMNDHFVVSPRWYADHLECIHVELSMSDT